MRILLVSQYFWPENFRANDLALELGNRGHQVTVLTGWPNYPDGRIFTEFKEQPERFAYLDGVAIIRVPLVPRGSSAISLAFNYLSFAVSGACVGLWKTRLQRYDMILVFQPSPITVSLPALAIGWRCRAPVILWVLDLWPESLAAVGAIDSRTALSLVGKLVGFIYRRCALILGQSRAFEDSIAGYSASRAKFRYFPNWIEPEFEGQLEDATPASELGDCVDTFNVVFAGNLGEAQGLSVVIQAAAILRQYDDIRWILIGDGRAAASFRRQIAEANLERQVRMVGRHPVKRMPEFFKLAGALLVTLRPDPTLASTIPGKVQSYLASGLPVIASLDGEGARVVSESGGGFVCAAGDAQGLSRLVLDLREMTPDERYAMGQKGREYCLREFNRTGLMAQLEVWMEECVRKEKTPQ